MKNKFFVYVLKDHHNNIFYVGKGCGSRESSHRHNAKFNKLSPLYNKIRKIWSSGNDFKFVKIAIKLSDFESKLLEKKLILIYKRKIDGGCLYNITNGGDGSYGYKHSNETKEKIKKLWVLRKQNYKVSDETRKKISIANKNRKASEETKRKLSEKISGSGHWNFGNKGSTKATIKMNEACRKKVRVNGVIFNSLTDAARFHNIKISTVIYRVKSGKNRGNRYGKWEYV